MRTILSFTFTVLFCMPWIQLNSVASDHYPITGAFYKRQEYFVDQLPSQVQKNIVQSLPICSALCQSESCNGFFYSNTTKICALIDYDASSDQMINMPGAVYYKRLDPNNSAQSFKGVTISPSNKTTHTLFPFTRDLIHDGHLANNANPTVHSRLSLADCATSCSDAECVGFFYDTKNGACFPVKDYFLTGFYRVPNMTYYKRQVNAISLDFNVCPPFKRGEIVIKMFNGENYTIFVDTDQVNQSVAANRCKQRQRQLLRVKDKLHHDYIQKLLSCADRDECTRFFTGNGRVSSALTILWTEFVGKEIWIGAEKIGNDWIFPDKDVLEQSYFCPNTPNDPAKQFCVRFLTGCLDDNECADRANFICE